MCPFSNPVSNFVRRQGAMSDKSSALRAKSNAIFGQKAARGREGDIIRQAPQDAFFAAFFGALLLMDSILYFARPRGVATSTVTPFLWPMSELPSGDSLEMRRFDGSASAEPTIENS